MFKLAIQFIEKSAYPYIASVANRACNQMERCRVTKPAWMKAPHFRTRDARAVTAEEFEVLTQQAGAGAIARAVFTSNPVGQAGKLVYW
jgi:hypothetical protein